MTWEPGYRELAPPEGLGDAVECLWVRVVPPEGSGPTLVLPDTCVDMIWLQDKGAIVAGPDTGPAPTPVEPGAVFVGVRFRPGAGGPALGLPLSEIMNRRVDLVDLRGALARRLPGTLGPSEALDRIAATAVELVGAGPPDPVVRRAVDLLARPRARVDDLPRVLELSERQLRRRFLAAVGYGPKTLQRVLRFRRFLGSVEAAPDAVDLADVALDAGYADQAHLTHEATRLAGMPPAALTRRS